MRRAQQADARLEAAKQRAQERRAAAAACVPGQHGTLGGAGGAGWLDKLWPSATHCYAHAQARAPAGRPVHACRWDRALANMLLLCPRPGSLWVCWWRAGGMRSDHADCAQGDAAAMTRALRPAEEELLQQRVALEGVCLEPALSALCAALRRSRALLAQGSLPCLLAMCSHLLEGQLSCQHAPDTQYLGRPKGWGGHHTCESPTPYQAMLSTPGLLTVQAPQSRFATCDGVLAWNRAECRWEARAAHMRAPPRGQGAGTAAQRAGEGGVTPAAGAAGGAASRCLPAPPGALMGWRAQPQAQMFICCSWLLGAVHENRNHAASQLCTMFFAGNWLHSTSHPLALNAPLRLQADRALHKALREADEQLRKMQARASSHADTSQALSQAAAACCGRLPPEAAAEAFVGTCAQLDVLRALRDRASAAEQLSAAAARLVSPPHCLSC